MVSFFNTKRSFFIKIKQPFYYVKEMFNTWERWAHRAFLLLNINWLHTSSDWPHTTSTRFIEMIAIYFKHTNPRLLTRFHPYIGTCRIYENGGNKLFVGGFCMCISISILVEKIYISHVPDWEFISFHAFIFLIWNSAKVSCLETLNSWWCHVYFLLLKLQI